MNEWFKKDKDETVVVEDVADEPEVLAVEVVETVSPEEDEVQPIKSEEHRSDYLVEAVYENGKFVCIICPIKVEYRGLDKWQGCCSGRKDLDYSTTHKSTWLNHLIKHDRRGHAYDPALKDLG